MAKKVNRVPRVSQTESFMHGAARGAGAAALSAIGWKLGMDLYEWVKRWLTTAPPALEAADEDDDI